MTLTEFLLARIAEDEVAAQQDLWADQSWGLALPEGERTKWANRMLAEAAAKRAIVMRAESVVEEFAKPRDQRLIWPDLNRRERHHANETLRAMASVYADHPDYALEWS